jgi:formate-nitrite transporter family protein
MSSDSPSEEDIRKSIDQAKSGAPAAGRAVRQRFSTDEIFQRVVASADEEVEAADQELVLSGVAAGFAITLTFLGSAIGATAFSNDFLAAILYPIGFIYIILGRYQLYTENTLPPVALVLTRLTSIPRLFRIWGLVLLGNVLGAGLGAFVLANSNVFEPETARVAAEFGKHGLKVGWFALFYKAVFAGWLVAGVVWLDHAARDTITRFVLIYFVFYTISAGNLYHVVVTASDALYYVFIGDAQLSVVFFEFWLPVLLGNTIGGVFLVTLVNYGQTQERRTPAEESRIPLSTKEWLFGAKSKSKGKPRADD